MDKKSVIFNYQNNVSWCDGFPAFHNSLNAK